MLADTNTVTTLSPEPTAVSFFFYCYGDHRDLHVSQHSFPTRRSSDLPDGEVDERGGAPADGSPADLLGGRAQRVSAAERRDRPVRVHVRVDAAGDDELAGGVDDAGGVAWQRTGRG